MDETNTIDAATGSSFEAKLARLLPREKRAKIADIADVPADRLDGLIDGTAYPRLGDAAKLAHALRVPLDWLLDDSKSTTPPSFDDVTPGMSFGEKLAALLAENRRTQSDVAKAVGVSQTTLSDYLRKGSEPMSSVAFRLAKTLDVPLAWLLDETQGMPPPDPRLDAKSTVYRVDVELAPIICPTCGIAFGVPRPFLLDKLANRDVLACPNGHEVAVAPIGDAPDDGGLVTAGQMQKGQQR